MVDQLSDIKCNRPKDFHSSVSQRWRVGGRAQSCDTSPEKEWKKYRRLRLYCWFLHSVPWDIGRVKWHLAIRWQIPTLTGLWAERGSSWLYQSSLILVKWAYRSKGRFILSSLLATSPFLFVEIKNGGGGKNGKQINFQGYIGSWEQVC